MNICKIAMFIFIVNANKCLTVELFHCEFYLFIATCVYRQGTILLFRLCFLSTFLKIIS